MAWLGLVGWLVVIVLIGFVAIYIAFEIVGRFLEFAEANPLTIAVIILIILVILLLGLKPGTAETDIVPRVFADPVKRSVYS